ncbi:MAG: aspartate aminotransferase family protein [Vicingaceae bacterium]
MKEESEFLSNLAQTTFYPYNLHIDKAEGSYLWDNSGKKYIDFVAGIAVANVGHRHPHVLSAIAKQSDKYLHSMVYGEFAQEPQIRLAQLLHSQLPEQLNNTFLVNSGTEANEAALKLAKRFTGRKNLCSFKGSYHGSTHGSLSVSGNEGKKYAFRPLLNGIRFLEMNRKKDLELIDSSVAGVIIEPVQGDAGVIAAENDFLLALRKRCNDTGALLIMDEIQSGMGRTGKMFAFQHSEIIPDILTLAKSLGGGLPIGAMISDRSIMQTLAFDPPLGHITTFGGNPLSAAAACAVIEIIKKERLEEKAENKGRLFKQLLKHEKIKEVRQIGLMIAVVIGNEKGVDHLIKLCKEDGLIIYRFLSNPDSFRISPPLNISEKTIRNGVKILLENLDKI